MVWIPPPMPLTQEEFKERWRPGISMKELDPWFAEWQRRRQRDWTVRAIIAGTGLIVMLAMAGMAVLGII